MKNVTSLFLILVISLVGLFRFVDDSYAAKSYTLGEVAQHGNMSDCWMIINKNVYNITQYISEHDQQLNIRPWCGKDATDDYNTKNGRGQAHSGRADQLLVQYYIGTLNAESQTVPSVSKSTQGTTSRYNILIPTIGTLLAYFLSLKILKKPSHSFIWNSIMLLGLIPSFVFGLVMILAKQFPSLRTILSGDILYYHVELSIIFGFSCVLHFFYRVRIFLAQGKSLSLPKNSK